MGFFYFDESIHPRAHFTLGAFVYSEVDLQRPVADALLQSGLTPYVDEFKSGNWMKHNPTQIAAREKLRTIVREHCRLAVVVAPDEPREMLGGEALVCLNKVLQTNSFRSDSHEVFLDQGLFRHEGEGKEHIPFMLTRLCTFSFEQNSREVLGLQLADVIAHTCASILLDELGVLKKKVKAGESSGYDPNLEIDLAFELWASVRHNFFAAAPPPPATWESQLDFQVDVESRGLHVALACEDRLRTAAVSRFGSMYLGCIH